MHKPVQEKDVKTFGDAVRFYRQKNKIKVNEICTKLNFTVAYLMNIETNKASIPNIQRIKELSEALGVQYHELLKYSANRVSIKENLDKDIIKIIEAVQNPSITSEQKKKIFNILNIK